MAIRPDYTIGTLTLVASSKNFTTAGSALQTGAVQAGDAIVTTSGATLIIASITGQNGGTLFENCPSAAAGANQPLRIRYQPDGSRYQGAARDLIEKLGNGNIESFAGLQGALDLVPVFVGPGVMKLVSKSEFGPDDTHKNLAELAALAKANNQFLVMGADGKLKLMALSDKFDKPAGNEGQLIDGKGALTSKADLPISNAMQTALNTKLSYNWIINGDFNINQRGGVKKPANGVYGFDRWKGHPSGIEQIIEALPSGEYTLTWSGGGNGTFGGQTKTSPIKATVTSGNTSVVVPQTATKVSVVIGDLTARDPWLFCQRIDAFEALLCQRYFQVYTSVHVQGSSPNNSYLGGYWKYAIPMRANPSIRFDNGSSVINTIATDSGNASIAAGGFSASPYVFKVDALLSRNAGNWCVFTMYIDAEL